MRARFARFVAGGWMGFAVQTLTFSTLTSVAGIPWLLATVIAAELSVVHNFLWHERWTWKARVAAGMLGVVGNVACTAARAVPAAAAEAAFDRAPVEDSRCETRSWGDVGGVDSGTIVDWHGHVCIPGVTVAELVQRLLHPDESASEQDDVAQWRVLDRGGDFIRIYLRLVRRTIVTVEYDTEHGLRFHPGRQGDVTAVSIMTSIREVGGGDRGLLWRLNSYWRYRQTESGVVVDVESLSLSRSVPVLIRSLAMPIINHVARESMTRTLDSLRERHRGR